MKKLALFVVLGVLCASCSVSAYAAPRNTAQSQARAAQKAQKKQQKAQKKYLKAQQKAQKKMIKHDRKNTHYPKHNY